MLTNHQMRNIGIGREPNAPLSYVADVRFPDHIMPIKVRCEATSAIEAENLIASGVPRHSVIETIHIL